MKHLIEILFVSLLVLGPAPLLAEEPAGEDAAEQSGAAEEARGASDVARVAAQAAAEAASANAPTDGEDAFEEHLSRQASVEIQLGLRLYEEYDDYRAISALKRYAILDNTPQSRFLSNLIVGQIYHRNEKPQLAALAFERATEAAPGPGERAFAYLLGVQELCLPLSYYLACRSRLQEFGQTRLPESARDIVDYQVLYTDVVLRSDYVSDERADLFRDPVLKEKAMKLIEADKEFHEIGLKSPALAGVMSGVFPGTGQMYNGRWLDGIMSLAFVGLFSAGAWYSFAELDSIPLGIFSSVLAAGFYSGGIYNAVSDAQRINAERYLDFFEELKDLWPRVTFAISGRSVSFGYKFDWPGPTLESETRKALEAGDEETADAPTED